MHYLMLISDNMEMLFGAEMLIKSIKEHSPTKDLAFSVVINGDEETNSGWIERPFKLYTAEHEYLSGLAEVWYCPYHWAMPVPSRWFVPPKMDTCVMIDVDMMACKDLTPLYELEKGAVHGVTVYDTVMSEDQWSSLGFKEDDLKYYFNFGMVVVPSKYMLDIGKKMLEHIPRILWEFSEHRYFSGQIALAYTLKELNLPRNVLSPMFNWYDFLPSPEDIDQIIFLHYMTNRHLVSNPRMACRADHNEYSDLISRTAKKIFMKGVYA